VLRHFGFAGGASSRLDDGVRGRLLLWFSVGLNAALVLMLWRLLQVSAALLIFNFVTLRNIYRSMGQTDLEAVGRLPPDQKHRQLDDAASRHHRCNLRESVVIWIHAAQAVGVLILIGFHP
jgi:hypothetical protein